MKRYIILGGGIAGLSCAIQLLKAGKNVQLFEKNLPNHAQGHAFILMPNGLNALKKVGVNKQVMTAAHPIQTFQLHQPDGLLRTQQKLEGAVGIRRGTLVDILTAALPENFIKYGHGFRRFEKDSSGYIRQAIFNDGTRVAGDVFIASDGIWSKARSFVASDFSLSPVRIREIVSVVKAPRLVKEYNGTFLKTIQKTGGIAVGMLPCDHEHLVWFIQYDSHHPHLIETTLTEQRERLFHLTRNWCHPIPELIAKTDFNKSYTWHTTDMTPLPTFHKNNLALIGDAAHVLLTLTSQGVSSALEDAICLSELIAKSSKTNSNKILEQYTQARQTIMENYFYEGRNLKEQFLFPMQNVKKMNVPLVFSAA